MSGKLLGEPLSAYHADDAIGSSKLSVFHDSPLDYYEQFVAKTRKPKASWSMDFGSAFHAIRESRETFDAAVVPMRYKDFRTAEARAWRDRMAEEGKLILNDEEMRAIELMDRRCKAHKLVSALCDGADAEVSWRHSFGRYTVKCRTDVFRGESITLNTSTCSRKIGPYFADYKVCASLAQFKRSWTNLGYARKAVFYQEVLATCHGLDRDAPRHPFFWIAISAEPPHEIQVYELGERSFPVARGEVFMDLEAIHRAYETSNWERPETIETIDYPFWAVKESEQKLLGRRARLELEAAKG
jgi:hypothetical protein